MTPPDDFDPDIHAPIERTRCLATAWFDEDPMPACCGCEPHDDGDHIANIYGGNVRVVGPLVTWPARAETRESAA